MTEEQYRKLCKFCDDIIFAEKTMVELFAVSFLHILREHPVFLTRYEHLFRNESGYKKYARLWKNSLKNKITLAYRLLKSIINVEKSCLQFSVNVPQKVDILFVSHLLNESWAGEDIYFGDLPKKLAQEGYSVAIAYVNHTGVSGKTLLKKIDSKEVGIVVIQDAQGFWKEIKLYCKLKKVSIHWKKKLKENNSHFYANLLRHAISDLESYSTVKNLTIAEQVLRVSESLHARAIITTYEGHAWERVVFKLIHSRLSKILCIGYVHAAVFRLQHSIARIMPSGYDPDIILTCGSVAKKQLEEKINSKRDIKILGSSRIFRQNKSTFSSFKNKKDICLVIPEGIVSEYLILLNFSMKCAALNPQYTFVIRGHPLLQGKLLKLEKGNKVIPNFKVSTKSLDDDIHDAKWALYRGSTAIIQSVLGGLMPIYIEISNEMTIDPLYQMQSHRPTISTPSMFNEVLDGSYGANDRLLLMQYCLDFYEPFSVEAVKEILKKNQTPII